MRHIRRAAVTGLFAIWLAPLATQGGGGPADAGPDAALRGGGLMVEDQQEDRGAALGKTRDQGRAEGG